MRFGTRNDSKAKNESIGKKRKTQLITTFGPGAITEMPEYTVIMGATDYWKSESPRINEPNLERLTASGIRKSASASVAGVSLFLRVS